MAHPDTDVFVRLERFYDALPRPYAVAEDFGALVLFVREGEGWPFYARPRIGAATPSAADITAVRRRQRALGVPEAFEWVHETTPDLLAVARSAGLDVLLAPLLALDVAALLPDLPVPGAQVRLLDPYDESFATDVALTRAVAALGFGTPAHVATNSAGDLITSLAGPTERDAAVIPLSETAANEQRDDSIRIAVAHSPDEGILATGMSRRVDGVAEIAGVATLPSARNHGYATQITAALARGALGSGADLIFLSAGDDDIARLYTRVGFRRLGTACVAQPRTTI